MNLKQGKSNKFNKSDIVIYILALVAFILMIIVLTKKNYISKGENNKLITQKDENISKNQQDTEKKSSSKNNHFADIEGTSLMNFSLKDFLKENVLDIDNKINTKDSKTSEAKKENNLLKYEKNNFDKFENENNQKKVSEINKESKDLDADSEKKVIKNILSEKSENKQKEIKQKNNEQIKTETRKEIKKDTKITKKRNEKEAQITIVKKNDVPNTEFSEKSTTAKAKEEENIKKKTISENGKIINYKVEKGDCLWKIAEKYKLDTNTIIKANKQIDNPDLILPGQIVYIPIKVSGKS